MRVLVLLLVAVAITAAYANSFLKNEEYMTVEERKQAMDEAIEEAKAAMNARELSRKNRVTTQNEKDGKYTSSQLLSKFFKKPSEHARKMGKANRLYRDIVNRAERKMFEVKRVKVAKTEDAEARAESLAEELFHRPGSMLTSSEVARAWQEAGELVHFNRLYSCNFPTRNLYRTSNGTCNNLRNPRLGSSGTAFSRLLPSVYEDGVSSLRGTFQAKGNMPTMRFFDAPNPSPRSISRGVIRNVIQDEIPFTHLLMQFGQFLDHDLDLGPELEEECEGCTFTDICQPIRVSNGDPSFGNNTVNNGNCLPFRRSLPVFEMEPPVIVTPLEQVNDVTSFIDGSMIYGSDFIKSQLLRSFRGGLLREVDDPGRKATLPIDTTNQVACQGTTPCFLCGDIRCNEQISLTIMHTLWLREHNRCARRMTQINPHWDDEKLYQVCRKIVGALIQKITYEDYLPKVLGSNFDTFIGKYHGYQKNVDPSIPNSFATAAYRYGHSLIRPFFDRLNDSYQPLPIGPLNLVNAFFSPDQFRTSLGTDPIMRGWVNVNSRRMDEFMNSVLTTQLFETPTSPGMDLASLNLQRGRDHGLPPYLIYRNFCFNKFKIISEIENRLTLVRFLQLYGSLETADLWIAGLAEDRPIDGLLGATFACIFGLTFQAVRDGDRFFWLRPGQFTERQRHSIMGDSFSRVICDNSDNITNIQKDAFLSGQRRVSCSLLEGVDLDLFREAPCHFRALINPIEFEVKISIFSRSTQSKLDFTNRIIPSNGTSPSTICIPIQCPTRAVDTTIFLFSSTEALDRTRITSNPGLPPNSGNTQGVYRATLPISVFNLGTGVFIGSNCGGCTENAFTFTIRAPQESDPGSDNAQQGLPKEIEEELNNEEKYEDMFGSIEEGNSVLDNAEMKKQDEKKKTAFLFSELEEALKNMN